MGRTPARKGSTKSTTERSQERRKTKRRELAPQADTNNRSSSKSSGRLIKTPAKLEEACNHCGKDLSNGERALFVEEEVGRIFCTEQCIAAYFTPEIERLEKEYHRRVSSGELSGEQRQSLDHLRWITLQEPDEVWREKTITGDYRYTLISEFQPSNKKVWCVCICLFLRGEPSFLYLAFPTRSAAMGNHDRKGERVQWVKPTESARSGQGHESGSEEGHEHHEGHEGGEGEVPFGQTTDRLADEWTEEETMRAQMTQERSASDIPAEEFSLYQSCLEETLETPDEVWSLDLANKVRDSRGGNPVRLYHFIRYYPDENPGIWYVIVARETDDEEQIEILDAFPTRDTQLVDRYRRGEQEIGQAQERPQNRVIH